MAKDRSRHQLVLHLTTRMAMEAIILKRLENIHPPRRQEWLRGLLVQGFQHECRVLKQGDEMVNPEKRIKFSDWKSADSKGLTGSTKKQMKHQQAAANQNNSEKIAAKPFAKLSQIIG